jgi:glycerol transport system ATP-binding protein
MESASRAPPPKRQLFAARRDGDLSGGGEPGTMTLQLDNVSKVVGAERHISNISLTFEHASLNVLLGPTLAGKTSLMRLMAGLDRPTQGRVLFDGQDVTGLPVQKRNVAMVYQQFINYPSLSVYENIASPLRVARTPRAEIDRRVREVAEFMHLTAMLDRLPLELSGGQQQRAALARALVKKAALVLLDEPLANLDYKLREEMRAELPRIFKESGAIFVYATTEPMEALLLGGNTATLHEGQVTQFGPTAEVYRRPVDLVTAVTFSDPPLNTVEVTKSADGVVSRGGALRMPAAGNFARLADGDYTLGVRPYHLHLARPTSEAVAVRVRVTVSEITGSESFIHVAFADSRWVASAHGVHNLPIGNEIEVWVDPARMFIFEPNGRLAAAPGLAIAA